MVLASFTIDGRARIESHDLKLRSQLTLRYVNPSWIGVSPLQLLASVSEVKPPVASFSIILYCLAERTDIMSTIMRTLRNLRKIGLKEYGHQMANIGTTPSTLFRSRPCRFSSAVKPI